MNLSPPRAASLLAVLAIVSAVLTTYAPVDPWGVVQLGSSPGDVILLLPGVYLGLVLCVGLFITGTRHPLKLALALVMVVIAWVCAWKTAVEIYSLPDKLQTAPPPFFYAVAGFFAGIVGSAITVAGVALASRAFRSVADGLRTIVIGAMAGLLLQLSSEAENLLPLFLVWQTTVAASIGWGLAKRTSLLTGTAAPKPA